MALLLLKPALWCVCVQGWLFYLCIVLLTYVHAHVAHMLELLLLRACVCVCACAFTVCVHLSSLCCGSSVAHFVHSGWIQCLCGVAN